MKKTGIYVHIPFCEKKCPYCDFYSRSGTDKLYNEYTSALLSRISSSPYRNEYTANSLYFGGGTPGLLGAERLTALVSEVRSSFGLDTDSSEVTAEINPSKNELDLEQLRKGGVNRISIGVQSADDGELDFLGRQHNSAQAARCISRARDAGFDNISLDLMIALPGQTKESLSRSVEFCVRNGAKHISAYILKIEPGTVFYRKRDSLCLPDDDEAAELYFHLCSLMKEYGFEHYEISNFCKSGYEGRHNLKYWHDEEYIGFGPSAHSFINGRRFFTPRSFRDFHSGAVTDDGTGGSEEEYIMLALRLSEGVGLSDFRARFGYELPEKYIEKSRPLEKAGYLKISQSSVALTEKGFLLSNSIISSLLS